jgi:gliding motility-associated lipoprotein GldH
MWVYIKTPGDSVIKKERVNIILAEATGKWLGRGMGEIWEQRMQLNLGDSINFYRKGTYEISLEQNMRINPLPDILHVGLRVEKIGTKQ